MRQGQRALKKCRYCDLSLTKSDKSTTGWLHSYTLLAACKSMATGRLLGTLAQPKPEK